jgi:hypothetical protein
MLCLIAIPFSLGNALLLLTSVSERDVIMDFFSKILKFFGSGLFQFL